MIYALFPGKFDPIHNGQVDIARRAARLFDEVVLVICDAGAKKPLFSIEERVEFARRCFTEEPRISVINSCNLDLDFQPGQQTGIIIGGLRVFSDFDKEFRAALIWSRLPANIEVVSLITDHNSMFISSSLVKEIAAVGGDFSDLVPEHVALALADRLETLETP
jgi:pantetheine-phosphate adenylyltransferase